MACNLVEFPTHAVHEWIMVQETIQEILQQGGATSEMIKEICARMKEVFEKYNQKFTFAVKLPFPGYITLEQHKTIEDALRTAIEGLGNEIHNSTNQVFLDRLRLEIELYKLRLEK